MDGVLHFSAETVVGYDYHIGIVVAELPERCYEGAFVVFNDFGCESVFACGGCGCVEIGEVKFKQPYTHIGILLQRLHQVIEVASFGQTEGGATCINRTAPFLYRPQHGLASAHEQVRGEPQSGHYAIFAAFTHPRIRPLGPVLFVPYAVAAVHIEPERIHQVAVDLHSGLFQPKHLVEHPHAECGGLGDGVRQFVVGRPIIVNDHGTLQSGSHRGGCHAWRQPD